MPKIPTPRRDNQDKPFRCDYCGRRFKTTDALVRHVFKKHPVPDNG